MTVTFSETYLKRLNDKMRRAKINNHFHKSCAVHFLPLNLTSILQPMDQGVIKVFKQYYRKQLVKWKIEKLNNTGEFKKKTNILE